MSFEARGEFVQLIDSCLQTEKRIGSIHLAKSLVQVGDILHRGQAIAISGYSGIDGAVTFPFGIPHVHFNVWLNGLPIDPFAIDGQTSLWRNGVMPSFATDTNPHFVISEYNQNFVM